MSRVRPHAGVVVLSQRELELLPEYSCTLPTGTTIGKVWRRREPYRNGPPGTTYSWWLGQYVRIDAPGEVGIRWWRVELAP